MKLLFGCKYCTYNLFIIQNYRFCPSYFVFVCERVSFESRLLWDSIIAHVSGAVNPLAPGRCQKCCRNFIFKCIFWYIYLMDFHWNWSGELATVLKSALVQVMAWCRQATSHNLNQCWLMFLSPHGVGRPQWVNFVFDALLPVVRRERSQFVRCGPNWSSRWTETMYALMI